MYRSVIVHVLCIVSFIVLLPCLVRSLVLSHCKNAFTNACPMPLHEFQYFWHIRVLQQAQSCHICLCDLLFPLYRMLEYIITVDANFSLTLTGQWTSSVQYTLDHSPHSAAARNVTMLLLYTMLSICLCFNLMANQYFQFALSLSLWVAFLVVQHKSH